MTTQELIDTLKTAIDSMDNSVPQLLATKMLLTYAKDEIVKLDSIVAYLTYELKNQ